MLVLELCRDTLGSGDAGAGSTGLPSGAIVAAAPPVSDDRTSWSMSRPLDGSVRRSCRPAESCRSPQRPRHRLQAAAHRRLVGRPVPALGSAVDGEQVGLRPASATLRRRRPSERCAPVRRRRTCAAVGSLNEREMLAPPRSRECSSGLLACASGRSKRRSESTTHRASRSARSGAAPPRRGDVHRCRARRCRSRSRSLPGTRSSGPRARSTGPRTCGGEMSPPAPRRTRPRRVEVDPQRIRRRSERRPR